MSTGSHLVQADFKIRRRICTVRPPPICLREQVRADLPLYCRILPSSPRLPCLWHVDTPIPLFYKKKLNLVCCVQIACSSSLACRSRRRFSIIPPRIYPTTSTADSFRDRNPGSVKFASRLVILMRIAASSRRPFITLFFL